MQSSTIYIEFHAITIYYLHWISCNYIHIHYPLSIVHVIAKILSKLFLSIREAYTSFGCMKISCSSAESLVFAVGR